MNKMSKKFAIMGMMLSLIFTGCGNTNDDYEETTAIEESLDDLSDVPIDQVSVDNLNGDNQESTGLLDYYKSIEDYGLYDEQNLVGIKVSNPKTGESKKYIFNCVKSFAMGSDEYGDVEDFMNQAKDTANGQISDEVIENSNIVMVIYVYESPVLENVQLREMRTFYEYEEDGQKKRMMIDESKFYNFDDDIYVLNRVVNATDYTFSNGVFIHGDDMTLNPSSLEKIPLPQGVYALEDLEDLHEEINKPEENNTLNYEMQE